MGIIAKPFGYLLKFCYGITHSYALALLIFTLMFKVILLPLSIKQQKASQNQARIRPKEMAIRKRYEGRTDQNARLELSNDLMKLYKDEGVSAAGGCLPLLIQLPIIYILYQIITKPLQYICMASSNAIGDLKAKMFELFGTGALSAANTSEKIAELFTSAGGAVDKFNISEIQMLSVMEKNQDAFSAILEGHGLTGMIYPDFTVFGGAFNLAECPTFTSIMILIPIFAALFQFASTFIMRFIGPAPDMSAPGAEQTQKTMLYMNIIFPLLTFFMAFSFPAILGLYWIYQSIFGAVTQIILTKVFPIPVYTPEQVAEIEAEMNKDYVRPVINTHRRSLHHIDEDEPEPDSECAEKPAENGECGDSSPVAEVMPPRKKYDKNGNKIRSLHFIDDDEDETDSPISVDAEAAEGLGTAEAAFESADDAITGAEDSAVADTEGTENGENEDAEKSED